MRTPHLTVAVLLLIACHLAPRALAEQAADNTIVLQQHVFNDPGSANMPSHVVLAPKGWNAEGGAWWANPQAFNILPSQDIKVTAPDGTRVAVGPGLVFCDYMPSPQSMQYGAQRPAEGQLDNGLPVLYMPQSLDEWCQWLTRVLEQNPERAGTTDFQVRVTIIPELTTYLQRQMAPFAQQQQQQNMQNQQMGLNMEAFMDAAALGFECHYTRDGKQWDELIVLGIVYIGSNMDSGTSLRWVIEPNVSYRAPAGQLEGAMPLLMTIANSVQQTPQWSKMKNDHIAAMNRIAAKGVADRSRIIAESNREINRIITEGYNERQAIQDKTHEKFINAIREVEVYQGTGVEAGTEIQLPSGYDHVYSNGNGEYILTNDHLYNPNTDPNVNNLNWDTMNTVE